MTIINLLKPKYLLKIIYKAIKIMKNLIKIHSSQSFIKELIYKFKSKIKCREN